jgi:hypothetical protein
MDTDETGESLGLTRDVFTLDAGPGQFAIDACEAAFVLDPPVTQDTNS